MSNEMVNVKKADLEFVRAYTNALEGMKALLTRERDEARTRVADLEKQLATALEERDAARGELAARLAMPPVGAQTITHTGKPTKPEEA